jgi:hypothetical protein
MHLRSIRAGASSPANAVVMVRFRRRRSLVAAAALALLASSAHAGPAADEVVTLRIAVDDLAASLASKRTAHREELAALQAEKAELQRQIRLGRVRAETLRRIEREDVARVEDLQAQANRWVEPATRAVAIVRAYLERSLPFAVARRREALDQIAGQLQSAQPDVARAMERLWRLLEEEAAMGREIAMDRQAITLDGTPQLAEVLRVSMAVLYVRTNAGELGWAVRSSAGWRFERLTDPAAIDAVGRLFAAYERNETFGPAPLLVPDEPPASGGPP